jgi:aminopeptidase YwaD
MRKQLALLLVTALLPAVLIPIARAQTGTTGKKLGSAPVYPHVVSQVCAACIRAHEEFLASDAMQGRGSGTHDELVAATYIASQLRQYGVEPAGDDGGYIQRAPTIRRKITSPPQLELTPPGGIKLVQWTYGKEFLTVVLADTEFSGLLRKLDGRVISGEKTPKLEPGSVVLITNTEPAKIRQAAASKQGAIAVLIPAKPGQSFADAELPEMPDKLEEGSSHDLNSNLLRLSAEAFGMLSQMPEGTTVHFRAPSEETKTFTSNAVGILRGSDPTLQDSAILISAHLDHLGIGTPVNGDSIYNGADDDASGTTAVLELARDLGRGRRPRRTVIFALFGSEEMGGLGSTHFREHPPVPLKDIAANLEFEMLGRPDPAVKAGTLWLTGWERSNLGPTLAAHGAHLVGDPHPQENFFMRSDNFVLAKKGVVAQTISSYGLHQDLHRPSDDLAHLDLKHMDDAIGSLLAPVEWLANSSFQPKWNPGGQP